MQEDIASKTGPNTPEGKARSSGNSTKHGLCGKPSKRLPGETQEDYQLVWDTWTAEYDSTSPGTARLLEFIVNDDRLVRFSTAAVIGAQIALAEAEADPEPDPARLKRLNKDLQTKLRYKTQHERSFQRSLRNIEQFGQRRAHEIKAVQRLAILENKTICHLVVQFKKHGIDYKELISMLGSLRTTRQAQSKQENTPPNEPAI